MKRQQWRHYRRQEAAKETMHSGEQSHISLHDKENPLMDAVATLPARDQTIIIKHKAHGYSLQEIANELNLSLSAVKIAAHRAYNLLRNKLTEE